MFATENTTPESEIDARIARLQERLLGAGLQGALILQNADLFYFSGTIQHASLFVPAAGKPLLMVRKDRARARAESPIRDQRPLQNPKKIPNLLKESGHGRPNRIGLEMDVLPAKLFLGFSEIFPNARFTDISPAIRHVRAVKSTYEIEIIREAARRSDAVAGTVAGLVRSGMTEIELAGKVEAEARKRGHQGVVRMRQWRSELFYGHLMSGPAAAVPSYLASPTGGAALGPAVAQGASFRRIAPREPILIDYVFALNGYISDHTRIFAIDGLPDDLMRAHETILSLQATLKKEIRPGMKTGRVYRLAREAAESSGYGDYFMGHGNDRIRFVGHGVGLELDEYPVLGEGQESVLEENMTIALEPKLIFPGRGVVGIENTHLLTDRGLEQLTLFPETVVIL
jgi:Xaa-Pro dipeptidase